MSLIIAIAATFCILIMPKPRHMDTETKLFTGLTMLVLLTSIWILYLEIQ